MRTILIFIGLLISFLAIMAVEEIFKPEIDFAEPFLALFLFIFGFVVLGYLGEKIFKNSQ